MAETSGSLEVSTLGSLGQAVVVNDLQRRVLYWNGAAEELFGWSAAEAIGRDVVEIVRAGEDPERDARIFRRVAKGEKVAAEYGMVGRDGRRFDVLSTITPVMEHGELVAIASVVTDLTDRLQAEEAARRLAFLVESSSDAIVGTDIAGQVTSWNEAAERLYGYPAAEAIGHDVRTLVTAGDGGGLGDMLSRWQMGERVELENFPVRRKDGGIVETFVTVSPVRDASGVVIGYAFITRDATERIGLERAAADDRRRLTDAQDVAQLGSFELDPATGSIHWSEAFRHLLGVGDDEVAAIELFVSRLHPDDRAAAEAGIADAWQRADGTFGGTFRVQRPDGDIHWLQLRTRGILDENGILRKVIGTAIDITERVQMEAARREAEERFRLGFERGAVASAMLDLAGLITRVNPVMCAFLDRTEAEIVGHSSAEFIHPNDQDAAATRERIFRGDRAPFERRFLHKDGAEVWGLVNLALVRNDDDTPAYLFAQVQDITERKSAEQMLEHMALHDPLTGLPNRVLLQDRLEGALARAAHYGRRVGVIFGDVDRFKLVNDTLGHAAGDQLLVELAARLLSLARVSDTVGRFSGDEFVMICEDLAPDDSTESIGRRLSAAFDRPFHAGDRDLYLTVSAGIVLPTSEEDAATCFRDGAVAMHRAKEHGRGRAELFATEMLSRAARLLDIESALRIAVERGDLRLAYQPIIDLSTGRPIAVEALCRWRHPDRGEISPAEFIPVAEQSGLIGPIGRFVIDESIRQIGLWRDQLEGAEDLWVSINLSSAQVSQDLVALCEQLVERDAEGGSFGFEITESVLMADIGSAIDVLRRLRQLGIPVSIDDFGTGYSSLEYLKLLPVHSLKIDQSFVAGLGQSHDPDDPSIVQAVIALARALSMGACAEGVETEEQRQALLALGCETAQGYLWSRPLEAADFERWYLEHRTGDASATA